MDYPVQGCRGCEGTAGAWGCPIHSPNIYVSTPNSDTMGEYIETLLSHIKELKKEIKEYKTSLSAEILSLEQRDRIKAEKRVKELEEGIEKVLKWRNLDGDGISDPLREELYNLVDKKKGG